MVRSEPRLEWTHSQSLLHVSCSVGPLWLVWRASTQAVYRMHHALGAVPSRPLGHWTGLLMALQIE